MPQVIPQRALQEYLSSPAPRQSFRSTDSQSSSNRAQQVPTPSDLTIIANAIPVQFYPFNAAAAGLTLGAGLGTFMTVGFVDLDLSEWASGTTCVMVGAMNATGCEVLARARTETNSISFGCRSLSFALAALTSSALVLGVSLLELHAANNDAK